MDSQSIKKLEPIMLIFLSLFYAGGINRDIVMEEYNITSPRTIQRYEKDLNSCLIDSLKVTTHVFKNKDHYIKKSNMPEMTWDFSQLDISNGFEILKPLSNSKAPLLQQLLYFYFSFEEYFIPYFIDDIEECDPNTLDSNLQPILLDCDLVEAKYEQNHFQYKIDDSLIEPFIKIIYSAIAVGNKHNLFDGII